MVKRVLGNDRVRSVLCWIAAGYIRLVHVTGRWTVLGGEIPVRLWAQRQPFILCFWHGRLLMMPLCWRGGPTMRMLISEHRDGQLIARTVSHFRIATIVGSTRRGGARALRGMIAALRSGDYVGITPDGPRGPRMRAGDGIAHVARLAGVPVVPAAFGIDRGRVLSSWDRFLLAWPFARGVIVWGEPIRVAADARGAALEDARQRIEDGLNRVTREADRLTGRVPVEPEPAPADTP